MDLSEYIAQQNYFENKIIHVVTKNSSESSIWIN